MSVTAGSRWKGADSGKPFTVLAAVEEPTVYVIVRYDGGEIGMFRWNTGNKAIVPDEQKPTEPA